MIQAKNRVRAAQDPREQGSYRHDNTFRVSLRADPTASAPFARGSFCMLVDEISRPCDFFRQKWGYRKKRFTLPL